MSKTSPIAELAEDMPEPLCPFFIGCAKRISAQHYRDYCARTLERDCLFGYTQCRQFAKNGRRKPREWARIVEL